MSAPVSGVGRLLTRATSGVLGRTGRWGGWHVGPANRCRPAWPMAVGAVVAPKEYTGRTREEDRIALAMRAYGRGLFLLDLIDVPAAGSLEAGRAWAPVWDLVDLTAADAVVVYSPDHLRVPAAPSRHRDVPVHVLTRR